MIDTEATPAYDRVGLTPAGYCKEEFF